MLENSAICVSLFANANGLVSNATHITTLLCNMFLSKRTLISNLLYNNPDKALGKLCLRLCKIYQTNILKKGLAEYLSSIDTF